MKRVSTIVAGFAALLASCAPAQNDAPRSFESEIVIRSLISAFESADTALILDLFWPEATYDDFPNQLSYQGIEEIVGYITSVHEWGDDVYMNIGRLHASESSAVAEWIFSAVQSRPMGDRFPVATGREVVLNGVTIIEVEQGRIIRAADYLDTAPLTLQLGGRIELPGGNVIEWEEGR